MDMATAVNVASANGRFSALASTTRAPGARSRASLTISTLWSIPVTQAPVARASRSRSPATAPDIQEVIAGSKRERVEDRAAREVVYVLGAVHQPRARAARPARNAVRQPILECVVRKSAVLPGLEILFTQPESTQRLHVRVLASHGAGS